MGRNIELKVRLTHPAATRSAAQRLAPLHSVEQQCDTYFQVASGRLKLRQIEGRQAQLIWYARSDQPAARASDYLLVPVTDPALLQQALEAACGVRCSVHKRREIYLWQNVRIHLDEVAQLGSFVELEAVLSDEVDDAQGQRQVEWLIQQLGLSSTDYLDRSYSDLLGDRI